MTEQFFLLHLEHQFETTADKDVTTVSIYGKLEDSRTAIIELIGFRPYFYVSLKSRCLRDHVLNGLVHTIQMDARTSICGITPIQNTRAMTIDKNHQVGNQAGNDYGDTSLDNVLRIYVRAFKDICSNSRKDGESGFTSAVHDIYRHVYTYAVKTGRLDDYMSLVKLYESNVDPCVHIINRLRVLPCSWTRLNTKHFRVVQKDDATVYRHTLSSDEISNTKKRWGKKDYDYNKLFLADTTHPSPLPPYVAVMSIDIECISSEVDKFPSAKCNEIIQISAVCVKDSLMREGIGSFVNTLFCIGTCADIENVNVHSFRHEKAMLEGFLKFITNQDPDIITGYNIHQFDIPYILDRLAKHNIYPSLGRDSRRSSYRRFANNQMTVVDIPGRVVFDVYLYVKKEFPMKSLKLDVVANMFLNKKKDDVHYSDIPRLYRSGPDTRAILGKYCVKDSALVLEIIQCKQTFLHMYERCRVFRTLLSYMTLRGQQVRIESMLHWYCRDEHILIDDIITANQLFSDHGESLQRKLNLQICKEAMAAKSDRNVGCEGTDEDEEAPEVVVDDDSSSEEGKRNVGKIGLLAPKRRKMENDTAVSADMGGKSSKANYDGAFVLTPSTGLYSDHPVACLDFASLYPSIMIAYNLCHTTLVRNQRHGEILVERGAAERSPIGYYFLKSNVKPGVLPMILGNLLSERNKVKRKMSDSTISDLELSILNGQQLALKVAANSIYGDCGAKKGKLFHIEIPSSVTAYGRHLLLSAKAFIETEYSATEIIYGDTDSVMVHLESVPKNRIWDCPRIGTEMADRVTEMIGRKPIRLQFENVSQPFLLISKKRYAYMLHDGLERVAAIAETECDSRAIEEVNKIKPVLKYKGLEIVRRDNCQFATDTQRMMLDMVMIYDCRHATEYDYSSITESLKGRLRKLLTGDVDLNSLIVSKEWKKHTKNPTLHDELVKKLQQRDFGSAPSPGDRVQYVLVEGFGPLTSRSEDPKYALEHNLSIDYGYYATLIANQLTTILAVVLPGSLTKEEIKRVIWPDEFKYLITPHSGGHLSRRKKLLPLPGNSLITRFFKVPATVHTIRALGEDIEKKTSFSSSSSTSLSPPNPSVSS